MRCFFDFTGACAGEVKPAGGAKDNWTRNGEEAGYCEVHRNESLTRAKWWDVTFESFKRRAA